MKKRDREPKGRIPVLKPQPKPEPLVVDPDEVEEANECNEAFKNDPHRGEEAELSDRPPPASEPLPEPGEEDVDISAEEKYDREFHDWITTPAPPEPERCGNCRYSMQSTEGRMWCGWEPAHIRVNQTHWCGQYRATVDTPDPELPVINIGDNVLINTAAGHTNVVKVLDIAEDFYNVTDSEGHTGWFPRNCLSAVGDTARIDP